MNLGFDGEMLSAVRAGAAPAFVSIMTGPQLWPPSVDRHTEPLRMPANHLVGSVGLIARSVASAERRSRRVAAAGATR